MNDLHKFACLDEELRTGRNLITLGFAELQGIGLENDFYHLPHQLLASGLERLMKAYFCLVYHARNGDYPDVAFMKHLGHNLSKQKRLLIDEYFSGTEIPLIEEDLEFLKNDQMLDRIIRVLSEFGKQARYYNFDIVCGREELPINPEDEWGAIEREIEDPIPYLSRDSFEDFDRDYYPRVNSKIIAKLEQFCRAVAMQFTLGGHGGQLRQMTAPIGNFIALRGSEFGSYDYRSRPKDFKDEWSKRTRSEVMKSTSPTKIISKDRFEGEWPFRFDEVIIECRNKLFLIVNIESYDFALNGAARSRFGYPDPHEAGVAILGKSIGPFSTLALQLVE